MTSHDSYYNSFYCDLARIDEKYNSFEKVQRFLPELSQGAAILDIGCGFGSVSQKLVEAGYAVSGMEINHDALTALQKKGITPICHDIATPFGLTTKYDLILLLDVMEHVFDPYALLDEAKRVLNANGNIIISVPLYFDIIDRVRILFSGSIVSYDNRCYGKELFQRFRSYNYDHLRFFRPADILEMCAMLDLKVKDIRYFPIPGASINRLCGLLLPLVSNRYTAQIAPGLLAHSMTLRVACE